MAIWLLIRDQTASFLYFDISCKDYRQSDRDYNIVIYYFRFEAFWQYIWTGRAFQGLALLEKDRQKSSSLFGEPIFEGFRIISILIEIAREFDAKLKESACWRVVDGIRALWG